MINKARKKRDDILNNLPCGGGQAIANKLGCSGGHVSEVLNGRREDTTELNKKIIYEAEMLAAINIWKNRFCKFKSIL